MKNTGTKYRLKFGQANGTKQSMSSEELKKEWREQLQDEFMAFWDEYKDKVGLGNYSDEVTRFWLEKLAKQQETQKAETISLIYSMILNKEVDDVEASKIINKIRAKI